MAIDEKDKMVFSDTAMEPEPERRFTITQPGVVWRVIEGCADLFIVEMREGEPAGSRHHLARITQGQMIFAFEPDHASGIGLLASVSPEGNTLRASAEQFRRSKAWPVGEQVRAIERWVETLSAASADAHTPSQFLKLEAGKSLVTDDSPGVLLSTEGIRWVRQTRGRSLFLGRPEFGEIIPNEVFPVTRRGWLEIAPNSEVDVLESTSADESWKALAKFQSIIFASLAEQQQTRETQHGLRFSAQAEANQTVVDAAMRALTTPLTRAPIVQVEHEARSSDPLLAACREAGRTMGLRFRAPAGQTEKVDHRDPVAAIARVSRVRYRQVLLRGWWWRHEATAMVAFFGEEKTPVALVPAPRHRFLLYDPRTGEKTLITPDLAAKVHALAYVFYRPLPEGPMDFKRIVHFGLEHSRPEILMIGLMGLGQALLALVAPVLTGIIFDTVIPGARRGTLAEFALFLVVTAVATALFSLTQRLATLRLEGKMDAAVQSALWDRLLDLPAPFFRRFTAGDLARRSLGVSQIRSTLTGPVLTSLLAGVFSLSSLGLMFYYSWKLALLGTALVGASFAVYLAIGYFQVRILRTATEIGGRIAGMTLQFIGGISKLRVAGAEVRAFAVWAREFATQKRLTVRVSNLAGYLQVFNSAFPVISTALIFYVAAQLMQSGGSSAMTTGQFLAFTAAFVQLSAAMANLSLSATAALAIVPLYERAKPILEAAPEIESGGGDPGELTGGIEINHVHFRYREGGPRVLRDVLIGIEPKEFVAIVGPSGSGKSTLFRLLLGFERPEAGAIYYDGQSLADLDAQAVRRQIGVVMQNGRFMTGDIYRNIVGTSSLTVEDAWEAARMAGLDEDIKAMPMGMHTLVSDTGGLSGGQRQRLMIARAIVNRPRIVLLDEATSALDNQTQAIVSQSLERLNATRVVIAHRLTTVRAADTIYVMDKGAIVESGGFNELLAQNGLFASLARRQLA